MSGLLTTAVALVIVAMDLVSATAFELTILHTNDVHARFEQYTIRDGRCHSNDESSPTGCFGGLARRSTLIKAIRNQTSNVLLLDAGDQYQGTPWFYYYKGKAACHFMNAIGYDAMSLGNHEFDNGIKGLLPFLRNISFPVVCSNIHFEQEPDFNELIRPSIVLEVADQRIGVVGYLTKDTPSLSKTGNLEFEDEVTSVQAEVDRLVSSGVTKIIALGHAGFAVDKKIAEQVKGVDVVIGGHTNTFLYSGKPPSIETPEGPYPLVVTQPSGEKVLVAEAYAFGKYLGYLKLTFDYDGRVVNWTGNPILLDKSIEQDSDILEEVTEWGSELYTLYSSVVGFTKVFLGGTSGACRLQECVLGNLIADGFAEHYRSSGKWPDLRVALMNGGGIRSSIEEGNITYEDVLRVMPFGNGIDIVDLKGIHLIQVLEYSIANYSLESRYGKFLQVSGLRIMYDLEKSNGNRVQKVEVICSNCSNEVRYVPLDNDAIYQVALPSYLAEGGDGYEMIPKIWTQHYNLGDTDADLIVEYLRRFSPVHPGIEGRIQFAQNSTEHGEGLAHIVDAVKSTNNTNSAFRITSSPLLKLTLMLYALSTFVGSLVGLQSLASK